MPNNATIFYNTNMTNTQFDNLIDTMTDEQFDAFMAICFDGDGEHDDVDIHANLTGDDYADAVLADIINY